MALFQDGQVVSFGGIAQPPEHRARAALIPAPVEKSVSFGRGTALGPAALLLASSYMELYDELLDLEPASFGILTRPAVAVGGSLEQALENIQKAVAAELAAGRLPVVIGGEHSVTLGALRALVQQRGADFTVLTLDAHLDLRDSYQDEPLSHACVMRRALDLGLEVRHLGVRSCSLAEAALVKRRGLKPVWARQVHREPDWLERHLEGVQGPVYLSLDLDGLDPSIMPATGTPEPGGLDWHQVSDWLLAVCRSHQVVGLDVVELAPIGGQPAWEFTAARLLYRAAGLALMGRRKS